MSLVVNHNLMAANVARNLNIHYGKLALSTQRLSTGLRVNSAADDAAGLAIRELQRADIAALHQGARNANDAVSMIQTADAALAVIDEKLIRMKELAEQAATGTYDSTQRLMIDSEFQAMAAEIDRIANATDFNGIHLLNGNLSGKHDGSGLNPTGAMKIHFGSGNDSAEDYYYVEIGDCTVKGLGLIDDSILVDNYELYVGKWASTTAIGSLKNSGKPTITSLGSPVSNTDYHIIYLKSTSLIDPAYTSASSSTAYTFDQPRLDSLQWQVFSKNGTHYAGILEHSEDSLWRTTLTANGYSSIQDWMNRSGLFTSGATYSTDSNFANPSHISTSPIYYEYTSICNAIYTHDLSKLGTETNHIVDDDLLLVALTTPKSIKVNSSIESEKNISEYPSIDTQDKAQQMLDKIDQAIERKDKIRAHLGALQNRLENTITNITTQAENLQAAESRISDVDVATEMTEFVRQQILAQSAVAMLSQANSMPQMAMQIIGG